MLKISLEHVRAVVSAAIVVLLLFAYLNGFKVIPYDDRVAAARSWNYFGSVLPMWGLMAYYAIGNVVALVGLVGMFWTWRASRWLLAAALVGNLLIQPFLGLLVLSAWERWLASLDCLLFAWLVVISFWTPFADRFRRTAK